ncbi:ROK family protein [Actinopolymorpha alba]|uniref:ROK family protein n=1 Tax=Actinopolymorpha alba TaxID=533267 RepID=UPI00037E2F85|nr:ROK family protein [Actinopolymorpha alba]
MTEERTHPPVIGVDVGGTGIKAGLVDHDARILRTLRRPTPTTGGAAAVLDTVVEVVQSLRAEAGKPVAAVGLAVPGIIDEARGVAVLSANLWWRDTPVRDAIAHATGLPVALGHDVRAACVAEWQVGAARGSSDVLLLTLGTGIGAGVVTDGRLLVGGGYAGQLGHVVIDPDGAACGCGQRGCLGKIASANAVVHRYRERVTAADAAGPDLSARDVARLAGAGEPAAVQVWEEAVAALVTALATAVTIFGSELVVLGGGLSLAGEQLLSPVREQLHARLTFQRKPRIVSAALGDESGLLGAAILGRGAATPSSAVDGSAQ